MKRLFTNKGSNVAYGIITAIFTLVPENLFLHGIIPCQWPDIAIIIVNRLILCVTVFVIANLVYCCIRKHRKAIEIKDKTFAISVEYADLFNIKGGKKIISFDECFTTHVGENPADVRARTVCGQYLNRYPLSEAQMQDLINANGIKPSGKSKCEQKTKYTSGTIVPNGEFLLMAFAKLDKNGLGVMTYEEYIKCLDFLWSEIDRYHGTDDVYLPILGSRIMRFDRELTQQELLDILIASYRLSNKKMKSPNKLHIVCMEREGFSLNDVYGVD